MAIQWLPVKGPEHPRVALETQLHQPLFAASMPAAEPDRFQPLNNVVPLLRQKGKYTQVITFGALQDPLKKQKPALQMRVTGVTNFQSKPDGGRTGPINRLADSPWKDGQKLHFTIDKARRRIDLSAPGFGPIGRVPDEISRTLFHVVAKNPSKFRFELSNVIAGMTKGAETIGLRINLIYEGNNPGEEDDVRLTFNRVLNDPGAREKVMLYQPATSPEEVLRLILEHEKTANGPEAAKQMKAVIDNIVAKLKDPKNKRILLLGHCKPDGDTLGCIAGLKNAILLMDPTREVEIAVDDKIPGLFRNKVPGMDEIKHPYNPEKIQQVESLIGTLKAKLANPNDRSERPELIKSRISALETELAALNNKANLLDPNAKYDLVVTMDIPTPTRFTDKFKPYLQQARDVIYIDHHPHRRNEWEAAKDWTGLDIAAIHDKNLAWVADKVGACAQMMTIIGNRLVPQLNQLANGTPLAKVFPDPVQQQRLARYVANMVTGMSTDTGSFTRTCNLTPDDMRKPVEERPNFYPEGTAKWLMALTKDANPADRIDKKWLRENVTYDLPDSLLDAEDQFTARDLMLKYAIAGKIVEPKLSLGFIQVDYDQMKQVWDTARGIDPEVTLLDVQNGFKYSEVMGTLRSELNKDDHSTGNSGDLSIKAKENYKGDYDDDRIAILICQDKKAGELDEKLQMADMNGLRLSLRSANGSEHAELLASLFAGGGHGAAAGARVDLPGVDLTTPLGIQINGQLVRDPATILATLKKNLAISHSRLPDAQKKAQMATITVVKDPQGKNCAALLTDIVAEIRKSQPKSTNQQQDGWGGRGKGGGRVDNGRGGTKPERGHGNQPKKGRRADRKFDWRNYDPEQGFGSHEGRRSRRR